MSESSLYEPGAILDSQTTDSQWADNLGGPPQYATQEHQSQIKEEVDESAAPKVCYIYIYIYFFLDLKLFVQDLSRRLPAPSLS